MTSPSTSTDKLSILVEGIKKQIFSDNCLKERVSEISIKWKSIQVDAFDSLAVPELEIKFKT
ncbi:MAG: hypothetical protein WC375_08630 [Methanomassiliicoccales archaeon]|jgi:hypothetical protein